MTFKLPNISQVWSFVLKFGGAGIAAFGVNTNNLRDMSVGSAVALLVHGFDSIFNSPKATPPST